MGCGSSVAARQPIGDVQTNLEQAIAPPTGAFDVKSGPTGITYKLKVLYPAKSLIVDFDRALLNFGWKRLPRDPSDRFLRAPDGSDWNSSWMLERNLNAGFSSGSANGQARPAVWL